MLDVLARVQRSASVAKRSNGIYWDVGMLECFITAKLSRSMGCWDVVLLLSSLGAARRARCVAAPGAPLERGLPRDVESLHPTRMHGSAKPVRELQNLLSRADHTEAYA
jgi:hypothetical protein